MAATLAGAASRRRVLIVDDNDDIRLLVRFNLQDEFTVEEAASTGDALRRIEAGERFDLVITDVIQPGMTGIEFTERLRREQPAMPVVILSAWITNTNAHVAIDAGAKVAMPKPYDAAELVTTVTALLT